MADNEADGWTLLKARFRDWRRRRPPGTRIPESLWREAERAAHRHGIGRTCRELGLGYYSLRRRLKEAPAGGVGKQRVRFVELPGSLLSARRGGVLELHDREGFRLRVELADEGRVDALVRQLWRERR